MTFAPSAAQSHSAAVEHERSEVVRLHARRSGPNVGSRERGASLLGGAALLALGAARRGWLGVALGALGTALALRGASGRCPVYRSLGIDANAGGGIDRELEFARATTVCAPHDVVRGFFTNPTAFAHAARFLEIEPIGADCWEVSARLPGGARHSWEIELAEEGNRIEWRAGAGAPFEHVVRVELVPAPADRGTEVVATVSATPPGGLAGLALGRWLHGVLERGLGVQLANVKQLIETGEIARAEAPAGQRSAVRRAAGRMFAGEEATS